MAAYNKFNIFVEDLAEGVHNLATHQLTLALCATANAPVATNSLLSNLTTISPYTNLNSPFNLTVASSAQSPAGTYNLTLNDFTISASGGAGSAFQYVVVYNDGTTVKTDPLICWFDYGSALTLNDGESLTVDFGSDGPTTGILFSLT